jgi:hypothetical protein
MLGRVRILRSNTYHVVIGGMAMRSPTTVSEIDTDFVNKILMACSDGPVSKLHFDYSEGQLRILNADFYQVILQNTLIQNLSKNSPYMRLYWLMGTNAIVFKRTANITFKADIKLD